MPTNNLKKKFFLKKFYLGVRGRGGRGGLFLFYFNIKIKLMQALNNVKNENILQFIDYF